MTDRPNNIISRRKHIRIPIELWAEELGSNQVYLRRTGNVSIGGVYLLSDLPRDTGSEITLKFSLPGEHEMIVVRGKVVRKINGSDGENGMNIRFIHFEGNGKSRMRNFIEASTL